eukprot:766098-Hanusia_phi.AAC.2
MPLVLWTQVWEGEERREEEEGGAGGGEGGARREETDEERKIDRPGQGRRQRWREQRSGKRRRSRI